MVNPCQKAGSTFSAMAFCNASLPIEARVADLISRLSLDDKIKLMDRNGVALPKLGLNAYNWWEESTHGISPPRNTEKTPWETNFAFPITTSMSFNRSLWKATAQQIGREARAFANAGDEFSTFWTPVVNLAREPRWGRNLETPGEDPHLTSEYARHFIHGLQEAPEDPGHVLGSACCKHYVANEMEGANEGAAQGDRHSFDAKVDMRDLVDSYMLPFQACVEQGQVTSLMCSYNAVNGVPSCANDWLLQTVARDSWGFDGAIVSDCDADDDVYSRHHYTATPEESVKKILDAGTDVDCGGFVTQHAKSAMSQGLITEGDLDKRLFYQFRLRMRLGHFDPVGPLDRISMEEVCSPYALALSRDGAAQGATLLKNDAGALPLQKPAAGAVAVIGPNGNLSESIAGYYGGNHPCFMKFWTLADAVREHATDVVQLLGVKDVLTGEDPDPAAVAAARDASEVVLGVGTDLTVAAEGMDSNRLVLSTGQQKLVREVAAAAKKPIILVVLSALPLDLTEFLQHPKVGAVLWAGQPSVAVVGLGDVLFGVRPPAGRLVQTLYPASYMDEISIFDFNMRPGPSEWPRPDCDPAKHAGPEHCPRGTNPGRTYRFYTGSAVLPFGFGLSYTTWKYDIVDSPQHPVSLQPVSELLGASRDGMFLNSREGGRALAAYAVNVTNTGGVDSDDVVLGFLTPPGAGVDGVPLKVLFGFERVHVRAGQTETVWLYPSVADFTQADRSGQRHLAPGSYGVEFGVSEGRALGMGFAATHLRALEPEAVAKVYV